VLFLKLSTRCVILRDMRNEDHPGYAPEEVEQLLTVLLLRVAGASKPTIPRDRQNTMPRQISPPDTAQAGGGRP